MAVLFQLLLPDDKQIISLISRQIIKVGNETFFEKFLLNFFFNFVRDFTVCE